MLRNAYFNSLKLTEKNHLKSLAFPNISTGVYGYPSEEAADIAIGTVKEYMEEDTGIDLVVFVCFDLISYQIYKEKLTAEGLI